MTTRTEPQVVEREALLDWSAIVIGGLRSAVRRLTEPNQGHDPLPPLQHALKHAELMDAALSSPAPVQQGQPLTRSEVSGLMDKHAIAGVHFNSVVALVRDVELEHGVHASTPNPQPAPVQGEQDKEHVENYQLLRRGKYWSVVDGIGNILRGDDLVALLLDAIRAARGTGGQSNG